MSGNTVLVCGSASCLWDDLKSIGCEWEGDIVAVNLTALFLPKPPKHWVSFHPDLIESAIPLYKHLRQTEVLPITHSSDPKTNINKVWHFDKHDKSGWFAVKIASLLYENVILAGIPVDDSPHFYDNDPRHHNGRWKQYLWDDLPKDKIKSLSGKTRDFFGPPLFLKGF